MEQQCFLSLKNWKKPLLQRIFTKFCKHLIKMATQKIVNLLDSSKNDFSNFATTNETLLTVKQRWLFTQKSNQLFNKLNRFNTS